MSTINIDKISIVHWYPELEKHKCGYCKDESGSATYGMWAEQLTVDDYQLLIDRGWRRSGKYCYKPVMNEICCPQYTIKCQTVNLQPSKSQKKIIKRFNKFLREGITLTAPANHPQEDSDCSNIILKDKPNIQFHIKGISSENPIGNVETIGDDDRPVEPTPTSSTIKKDVEIDRKKVAKKVCRKGVGADPTKPPSKKAKLIRLEKRQEKLSAKGMQIDKTIKKTESKSLEQLLAELDPNSKHKLKIELISTTTPEWELTKRIEYELYNKYQQIIHNDPPTKWTFSRFSRFLVKSPLKLTLERMSKTHPSFKTSAELFRKYQMAIHNDKREECAEKQFVEFLVESPLKYWLDEKLIAVGVLDILPNCISSVYFFYDPDYRMLNLGTYGALREMAYVKSLRNVQASLQYYYMGYYIHSCQKMRYKGKFNGSFLLCPETYKWFPIEECIGKLELNKYSRFNEDLSVLDEDACAEEDIDNIKVCYNYSFMPFAIYKQKFNHQQVFDNIGRLVGKKAAEKLLFFMDANF